MRKLRRILGDDVLNIIPITVRYAVDTVYKFSKINPEAFQYTPFDSEQDKLDSLDTMRAYAEMAGDNGYTIYVQADQDPSLLIWKVSERRTRKSRDSEGSGE